MEQHDHDQKYKMKQNADKNMKCRTSALKIGKVKLWEIYEGNFFFLTLRGDNFANSGPNLKKNGGTFWNF